MKKLTRREFIKLGGAAAAAGLLAGSSGCVAPKPNVSREDVLKFYPDAPSSKVVRTAHPGAWAGEDLVPDVLRQMLDGSITELTGLKEPRDAWSVLFSADEKVAIKTNATLGGTHLALVMVLTECLQDAGVLAEQIFIFDQFTTRLEHDGYPVNFDGPGVRCYGNDEEGAPVHYTAGWTLLDQEIKLSDVLLGCDALINVPVLKRGGFNVGISFGMKNHYGTFDIPRSFHDDRFERGIPELNALPPIKDRTRLIVGDALANQAYVDVGSGYETMAIGNTILMGSDPVAIDAVGLQMVVDKLTADGRDSYVRMATTGAEPWLAVGAEIGLGTNDPANIDLKEVNLG